MVGSVGNVESFRRKVHSVLHPKISGSWKSQLQRFACPVKTGSAEFLV